MAAVHISRRDMLRYSVAGAAALGGGAFLGACGGGEPVDLAARAEQGYPIRLAVANEPPYTVVLPNGKVTGAGPEVAKAVLGRMGIPEVEPQLTAYDSMIPGLRAGRWDMITAGFFMNQKRCARVLYSAPVLVSTESFATAPGNPLGITSIQAVKNNPDITIGALAGSYELGAATSLGIPRERIKTYPGALAGLQALDDGRIDALLLPTLSLRELKEQQGGDFFITEPLEAIATPGSGHAFQDSDQKFHSRYNPELKAFKQTEKFAAILEQWGFSAEAARAATREELCNNPA